MKMKIYENAAAAKDILARGGFEDEKIAAGVKEIVAAVRDGGDRALFAYSEKFDGSVLERDENGDPIDFAEVDGILPSVNLSTTLYLEVDAGVTTGTNLYQDPIASIMENYLGGMIIDLALYIANKQKITFALDIEANLDFGNGEDTNYLEHLISGSTLRIALRIYRTGDGISTDPEKEWAVIYYYNGNLYIDLRNLNSDRVYVADAGGLLFGNADDAANKALFASVDQLRNATMNSATLGVDAQINSEGLFLIVKKTAIASLLRILGFGGFDVFPDAAIQIYAKGYSVSEGVNSLELGNAMLLSQLKGAPVSLPLNAGEFDVELEKLIANSRKGKKK